MKRPDARKVAALSVFAGLLVFVLVPLGLFFWRSLSAGPGVFGDALADPTNRSALGNTLAVGAGVAIVALFAGAPLGAALARLPLRGGSVLGTLLVLPIAAPPYVWAMAWITLGAPRAGWLNRLLASWGSSGGIDVYGLGGIVFVLGLSMYPLVLLPTRAALEGADPSFEEAARISGAGPLRAFVTGSLPRAVPAAVSGALLAFLGAISAFGVPYLLGVATERPVLVATTRIYQALALGSESDVRAATALCAMLLVVAALATWAASRAGRGSAATSVKGKRPSLIDAPGLTRAASAVSWLFASVAVILPASAIVLAACTKRFGDPPGPGNLTLSQFTSVLGKSETQAALAHSAVLAVASASAIVAIGVLVAFARGRAKGTLATNALARLAEGPYAVPGSVLALALLLAFSQEIRVIIADRVTITYELMGTLFLLGVAYVIKYLAFGVRAAENALKSVDVAIEESARISGAGAMRAFWDATLPMMRPALLAAWILALLPAATELTMSVLLAGPKSQVLGTVLFELTSYADPPSAAVLACVCLALVVAADVLLRRFTREAAR